MIQLKFSPKYLFLSNGANSPVEFPSKVGAGNVNGIFSSGDWFPDSKSAGNPAFVAAYLKKYGGNRLHDRLRLGRGLRRRAADPGRRGQDELRRQRHDHQDPAQGRLADDRGQPQLGRQRQPEGQRQPRRVGRRQAPPGLPGERRAPRADDPEAGLEGLGPAGATRARAPPRPGVHPRPPDRGRVCADGERPHAGLRRHARGQRGPGGADRARRLPEPQPLHGPGHRPVRLDPDHDAGRVRARRRAAARLPAPAAQRRARAALAARHLGRRAGHRRRAQPGLQDHLPLDDHELRQRLLERRRLRRLAGARLRLPDVASRSSRCST